LIEAHFNRLGERWIDSDYSDNLSRIYWIDKGQGRLHHHGQDIILCPGNLYLIPAGTVFSYACEKCLDQHWIHFTATLPGGLPFFELVDPEYVVKPDDSRTGWMFERIETLIDDHRPRAELEKTGILFLLLASFLGNANREVIAQRRKAYLRFRDTLKYIDTHLSESLRIATIARVAHLERTYFSRIFRQCLGIKPVEYIMRRRVERAKQRLWGTDEPLRIIAESLGFTDAFHFSKCFKRLTGITPTAFRELRQDRKSLDGQIKVLAGGLGEFT